ncbi:hypothetical protein ACFE04_014443 [Oxalis oulophora]
MDQDDIPILTSEQLQDIELPVIGRNDVLSNNLSRKFQCIFTKENNALESEQRSRSAMKLSGLIIFYLMVIAIEIVGGFKANSLAVITDAAHLLTDVAGFAIALFTVWASGWDPTLQYSFGFGRLEVLGALFSVFLIWLMSCLLIKEAVERIFQTNSQVNGKLMFAVAFFGFIVNLSLGVMIAGGVLWLKPNWLVIDLICTIVFSTFALFTTIPMLRNIYGILMERLPREMNISRLEKDLKCIKGVQEILDLHVWTITVGQVVLSCHIQAEVGANSSEILTKIRDCCKKKHRIYHVTVQLE